MAGVAGTGADVIGVEQEGEVGVEGLVAGAVLAEQELLEEPGGVGAVPFGRAGIRHRLDQLILGRQGGGPALGLVADGQKGLHQILGETCRGRRTVTEAGVADRRRILVSSRCLRSRERTLSGEARFQTGRFVLDRGSVYGKKAFAR